MHINTQLHAASVYKLELNILDALQFHKTPLKFKDVSLVLLLNSSSFGEEIT